LYGNSSHFLESPVGDVFVPHPVSGERTALILIHTVEFVHTYYAEEIFVLMIHRFGIDQSLEVMSFEYYLQRKIRTKRVFFGISGRHFLYRFEM